MNELVDQEFWDASTVEEDIEEEVEFGSLQFKPIRARTTTIVDVKTGQRNGDDFRKIIFYDPNHRPEVGTRFRFDGCIWLSFATKNLKTSTSSLYAYKCNHTLNSQDKYGQIHREPCYIDYKLNETQMEQGDLINVPSGRLNFVCQLNQWTKDIDVNQRYIVGGDAYMVRYRAKYERHKTFDDNSPTIVQLYMQYDNKAVDDNFDLQIANYKVYNYTIECEKTIVSTIGSTGQIIPTVLLDGAATAESCSFYSSNESIVTVNSDGNYTLVADGTAEITVSMANAPMYNSVISVTVGEETEQSVYITPDVNTVKLNQEITYTVNGTETYSITVQSENPNNYYKFTDLGNNKFKIKNYRTSALPVVVTYTGESITGVFEITLGGFR